MINAICNGCGQKVYRAVNERNGQAGTEYYSERVLYRLMMHNGGTPKAVPVHGLYEVHKCRTNGYTRPLGRVPQSQKGVVSASKVRARRRRKIPVSSGREM